MTMQYVRYPTSGFTNPMTTAGDLIYGGTAGTPLRLGIGSSGQVLTVSGGLPVWAAPGAPSFPLLAPDGSAAAPSYSFSGEAIGIYRPTAGDIGFASGAALIAAFGNGRAKFNVELRATTGNVSVPNYSFLDAEPDKGMYDGGAGIISFATGGVNRLNISSTSVESKSLIYAADGLAAGPGYSFTNDTDTGIFRGGSGILDFSSNGSTVIAINPTNLTSSVAILNIDGSAGAPSYSFTNDTDTGIVRGGSGILDFVANGSTVLATTPSDVQVATMLSLSGAINATQIATPTNPSAGHNKLYFKSDNSLYSLTSGGVEAAFSTGTSFPLLAPAGSAGAPSYSFSSDSGTGIYYTGSSIVSLAAGGGNKLDVTVTDIRPKVPILLPDGNSGNPYISFLNDPDNGFYLSSTNQFSVTTGGTQRVVFDALGNVNILTQKALILFDTANTTGFVGIRASGTQNPYTITLPASAPTTNALLQFDGTNYVWSQAVTLSGVLTVNPGVQNASLIRRYANAGDGTGQTGLRVGNSGASQGDAQFFYTNAAAAGAPNTTWTHTPRNNADSSNTDAVRVTLAKTAGNDGGEFLLQTATTGGTLTNAIAVDNTQAVVIGTGTGATHRLNTALGTNGAAALTLLNGPAGTTGNPTGYIQISINGTNRFIPFW